MVVFRKSPLYLNEVGEVSFEYTLPSSDLTCCIILTWKSVVVLVRAGVHIIRQYLQILLTISSLSTRSEV
ncbi:hypothetical protein H5410_034564 [Solanum commersonii]|uniref:Uncharacterized protein n=1 Tax=Solanum commersonii TaxID=4109 RepID=A0A9J5YS19_SOLCO|nr:hypothetical protein H5410_034564 [Solanum commersonii]